MKDMQRVLHFLIVFFFISLFNYASAQSYSTLNGKVLNAKNEPVAGASVSVKDLNRKIAADVEGRFSIKLETGKKYTLTVSAVGFKTKEVE